MSTESVFWNQLGYSSIGLFFQLLQIGQYGNINSSCFYAPLDEEDKTQGKRKHESHGQAKPNARREVTTKGVEGVEKKQMPKQILNRGTQYSFHTIYTIQAPALWRNRLKTDSFIPPRFTPLRCNNLIAPLPRQDKVKNRGKCFFIASHHDHHQFEGRHSMRYKYVHCSMKLFFSP